LQCRGIRGAITVSANNKESILAATEELLKGMAQANSVKVDDIAASNTRARMAIQLGFALWT
jgi:chorismate mutase